MQAILTVGVSASGKVHTIVVLYDFKGIVNAK